MKRLICITTIIAILLISASCGSSGNKPETTGSTGLLDISSENPLHEEQKQTAVSLDKFKTVAKHKKLGEITELNGNYGYDAALINANDGTNYIYMYMADPDMAKAVLTDSDDDGVMDSDFSLTKKGNGYELYTQESMGSGSEENSIYGRCLLAGSMIVIVSGTIENKEQIKKNADEFMKDLGYDFS